MSDFTCSICGCTEFYPRLEGGYSSKRCKRCAYRRHKEYRARNRDKYAAYARKKRQREGGYKRYSPAWYQANRDKILARQAVYRAVRDGRLVRECCSKCGATSNVEAHHFDYSKRLEVTWMCHACHEHDHAVTA